MSDKPKILIQLDSDEHPSVFDSVVAIDSGVDHLLQYGSVQPIDVQGLVHGAMFTRGGNSLRNTAIFIGGSNVNSAEQIMRAVTESFFGKVRVSVMMDANGANTTASAAVLCLQRHMAVKGKRIGVLAATGAVGNRVARILAGQGAIVRVASRKMERVVKLAARLKEDNPDWLLEPFETGGVPDFAALVDGCDGIVSAGAASIRLLQESQWKDSSLQAVIDLNAVPPSGIEGVEPFDDRKEKHGATVYGAIGVGNLKMRIHRRCVESLFEVNDRILGVDEIYQIGSRIEDGIVA